MVRGIRDMYLFYRYKKYEDLTKVPNPYFPKQEHTDNKNSLTKQEWTIIAKLYLEELQAYLFEGALFEIPSKCGSLQIVKTKFKKIVKNNAIVDGEPNYYKNSHTNGYSIRLRWWKKSYAGKFTRLKSYSFFWRCTPVDYFNKAISKKLLTVDGYIYNFRDI